ncbi:MAG: hypothetical protein KJ875_15555 [Alphaproteobacteria bacterium]|nr:hypothetical protein [Alphaproteobacteria bacterium]MBU2162322.1 hypothetical protein [Alphaproteobacteria bacterium]MBU2243624.1 hypothetical protein [Alphaproteobacteria bacterium]
MLITLEKKQQIVKAFHLAKQIHYPPISFSVTLTLEEKAKFNAEVSKTCDGFNSTLSGKPISTIDAFLCAKNTGELKTGSSSLTSVLSLVWLILHELSHIDLNHFELADSFGIAQRSSMKPKPLSSLPEELRLLAPLCLEMQADHEATEMLLGAYSTDDWQELREKVVAISGMMMLIELEDTQNGAKGRTHPKAATRIFQLLGHLAEMPLVHAQITQDASLIPPQDELQAFAHDVTVPCFFDAIELAQTAGAASIAADLGTLEDFFKDLEIAKLGDPSRYKDLKTQGAQEWAKLWPCNEALKQILWKHQTI